MYISEASERAQKGIQKWAELGREAEIRKRNRGNLLENSHILAPFTLAEILRFIASKVPSV